MIGLLAPSPAELTEAHVDITAPQIVEVVIDWKRSVVHVNVDGICVLRVCRVPKERLALEQVI